jgi:hypothetical protein
MNSRVVALAPRLGGYGTRIFGATFHLLRKPPTISRAQKTFPDAHFFVCHFSVIPFSVSPPRLANRFPFARPPEFHVFAVSRFREKKANQSRPSVVFSGVSLHRFQSPLDPTKIFFVLTSCRF